jgi:hypothetical protein
MDRYFLSALALLILGAFLLWDLNRPKTPTR